MAGLGVGDESTVTAQLERIRPDVQAMNMAKISYGIDQAVLRYERDAEGMEADFVLLTAIDDNFNRARWDRFFGYWPKPRFAVKGGELEITAVPVPDFSAPVGGPMDMFRRSALFLLPRQYFAERTYDQDDEKLATLLLDRLGRLAAERGHRAALAYFPTLSEMESGEPLPLAGLLERDAARHGLPFIQLASGFGRLGEEELRASFLEGNGHYSERGGRIVAEALLAELGPLR